MPKTPAEYIAAVLPEKHHGSQTLLFAKDAEAAVAAALADADRYRELLVTALRRSAAAGGPHDSTQTP